MHRSLKVLVFLAALAAASSASAVCLSPASTNPSLFSELVKWSTANDTTLTIKLEQGTYNIDVGLDQRGPGQHGCCGSSGFNAGLVLKGGYKPGTSCDENQRSLDASLTTLEGSGGGFYLWSNGPMTVSGLRFRNYGDVNGVTFFGLTGTDNPLKFDHVIGYKNETIALQGSSVNVQNMLVYGQPPSAQAALILTATDSATTANHLTVVGNSYGLDVGNQFGGNIPVAIFNSIVYFNSQADIIGYDAADNNDVKVYSSIANVSTAPADVDYIPSNHLVNVLNTDPIFVDSANDDFSLQTNPLSLSPAINDGTNAVIGGEPATDITGNPRVVGGVPDMGAYESPTSYFATYTVTTTADNGDNVSPTDHSLRWAIVSAKQVAEANVTLQTYRIVFNVPLGGSCPGLIIMNPTTVHPFPDIDFDLTIDATTQPGWVANTTFQGFNATLCMQLNGAGVYANAFQTVVSGLHKGRLSVLGMRFGGFTDAAIKLNGGSGHHIFGNQIGGAGFFGNASNTDGIRITGTTGTSFVGAFDDPSTRNLIIDNTGVGVRVDSFTDATTPGSYIVNNLIGLAADGSTAVPNGTGIFISGSPRHVVEYNTIASSTGTGLTISGATSQFNTVQYNSFGYPENTGGSNVANGTQAIVVNTNAANNTIGTTRNSVAGGNIIATTSQGVYVSPTGGSGNLTLANTFLFTASLPIDLGAAGTTPNDAGDGDAGPNGLQNFPVVLHAYRTQTYEWIEGTLDTFANDAFRLDFYLSGCCTGAFNVYDYIGRDSTGVTDAAGHVHFWARLPAPAAGTSLGSVGVTAMAGSGDTSEIGTAVIESTDMIFRDDFDHAH